VLAGRDIAAAVLHDHFHDEGHVIGERRQHMLRVQHFDRFIRLDVGSGDRAGAVLLDTQHARRVAVILHHQRFDVEHDVGDVLEDALDRREFVLRVVHLDLRHCAAFQAGEQHAAQTVADRRAETALERLGGELAVGRRERGRIHGHHAGQLQSTPSNMHGRSPDTG
jgi:hypothetical protein